MSNEESISRCKITCTLPNAGDEINGIEFESENGAMVAYNVPADKAEKFASIPGYMVDPQQGSGGTEKTGAMGDHGSSDGGSVVDSTGAKNGSFAESDKNDDDSESGVAGEGSVSGAGKDEGETVQLNDMSAKEIIEMLDQQPDSWPVVLTMEEARPVKKQRNGVLNAITFAKESLEGK